MPSLTVYRMRSGPAGTGLDRFDHIVEPDALPGCTTYDFATDDLAARLYVPAVQSHSPLWAPFVTDGFPTAAIGPGRSTQALLVASVRRYGRERLFAIPFGHARHLIRAEFIEPTFGRRVALNLLYEPPGDGSADQSRVRQVDVRTVEANVRRARVQRSRDTTFETFGVDPERDMLDRIVGQPHDEHFGTRISGGDSIHLDPRIAFAELGGLLRRLLAVHGRTTYREHFGWVDRVQPVADEDLLQRLRELTADLVRTGSPDLDLAPPELVDWDRIDHFVFEFGQRPEHADLRLSDYLAAIAGSRVSHIDEKRLAAHLVSARDGDGTRIGRWSVFRCLFGELRLDGVHYILDNGRFWAVAGSYLAELDAAIDAIPAPTIALPATVATDLEDTYNKAVAAAGPDRLLLDKKNVQPAARTTSIEICDVMTASGELIHAKRKLGSSDLSHLFSQGYVSAETMHAGPDFRAIMRDKMSEQAREQGRDAGTFTRYLADPFRPGALTVVYAVLADWHGAAPKDRLPFFSKVNLRHHHQQLRRMGFNVAFAAVEAP